VKDGIDLDCGFEGAADLPYHIAKLRARTGFSGFFAGHHPLVGGASVGHNSHRRRRPK